MALVAPAVLVLLAASLWGLRYAWVELRCTGAAAAAAEAAGRGAPLATVLALAQADAPGGAEVAVSEAHRTVTVTVRVRGARRPWPLSALPPLDVTVTDRAFR